MLADVDSRSRIPSAIRRRAAVSLGCRGSPRARGPVRRPCSAKFGAVKRNQHMPDSMVCVGEYREHAHWRSTFPATLPRSRRVRPVRACVVMTIRSISFAAAVLTIAWARSPSHDEGAQWRRRTATPGCVIRASIRRPFRVPGKSVVGSTAIVLRIGFRDAVPIDRDTHEVHGALCLLCQIERWFQRQFGQA